MNPMTLGMRILLIAIVLSLVAKPAHGAFSTATFPTGTFLTVSATNQLERFNVAAPGTRLAVVNITGLRAGDDIVGIDFRPATGGLYGLGRLSQIYLIDAVTGQARLVGGQFTPALDIGTYGFDFNPANDRIRIVSSSGQNLLADPEAGQLTTISGPVSPPGIEASAYNNNFGTATVTTLYGIDPITDSLYIQQTSGALTLIGPLGVNVDAGSGFDIAPFANLGYAVLTSAGVANLYTINLLTGAATLVGTVGGGGAAKRGFAYVTGPEMIFAVTTTNRLLSFRSSAPGSPLGNTAITGLQPGENLLGIDFRPSTAELYAIGSTSRLYRIDTASALATQVGGGAFAPSLAGNAFGFDFNPVTDQIRVVSDAGQNLRINPDLATVVTDSNLSPVGNVVAAAHANNVAGAASTTLYDIDSASDELLIQNPANGGALTVVGPLNVDASSLVGFDIGPAGPGFAVITLQGGGSMALYRVTLGTGGVVNVGTVVGDPVRDIAIALGAEVVHAVTQLPGPASKLIRFNTASPQIISSSLPIIGLQAGETILGVDFRPLTGQLYALGSTSRLYTLDTESGAATQVGADFFSTLLNGTRFGFDFNAMVDRIRVVSDAEQNLVLNPDTADVIVGPALSPAGNVAAAAYTNNTPGAASTTLLEIDWAANNLMTQNTTTGVLTPIGPLGITLSSADVEFDVASISTSAYMVAYTGGANPILFRINTGTGAATLVNPINTTETLVAMSVEVPRVALIFVDSFE